MVFGFKSYKEEKSKYFLEWYLFLNEIKNIHCETKFLGNCKNNHYDENVSQSQ